MLSGEVAYATLTDTVSPAASGAASSILSAVPSASVLVSKAHLSSAPLAPSVTPVTLSARVSSVQTCVAAQAVRLIVALPTSVLSAQHQFRVSRAQLSCRRAAARARRPPARRLRKRERRSVGERERESLTFERHDQIHVDGAGAQLRDVGIRARVGIELHRD
jgi:hypothetical protein